MDALAYLAAKAKGLASITKPLYAKDVIAKDGKVIAKAGTWDGSTIIVSVPGGFDPTTGEPKPPIETGMQLSDFDAHKDAADKAVADAQAALAKAQAQRAAIDTVLADATTEAK